MMEGIKSELSSYSSGCLLSSKMLGDNKLDNKVLSKLNSKLNQSQYNVRSSLSSPLLLLTKGQLGLNKKEQLHIKSNIENTLLKTKPQSLQNKCLLQSSLVLKPSVAHGKRPSVLSELESNVNKLLKLSAPTENRLFHCAVAVTSSSESPLDYKKSDPEDSALVSDDDNQELEEFHSYNLEFGSFSREYNIADQILERTDTDVMIKTQLLEEKLKMKLMHTVSSSLIQGSNMRDPNNTLRKKILETANSVADFDAEFVLKVALYTREELNIRTVSNFLLAFAANNEKCRIFLLKYFSSCVRLPSDWIEVADLYQHFCDENIKPGSLPASLRKAMAAKFPDFDAYQLAKYNNENKMKKQRKKQKQLNEQTMDGPSYASALKRVLSKNSNSEDEDMEIASDDKDKHYKQFTLKQLVRLLHLTKPAEFVMSLLGKKYPSDISSFYKTGLPGLWVEELAGKRMKLPLPETWETQLSLKGNKASTWEQLLDNKKLPFMAMLRNLRNFILSGISQKHHKVVTNILTNQDSVIRSRQFPMRFLQAFKTLDELQKLLPELCKDLTTTNKTIVVPEHLAKWTEKKKRNIALRKRRLNRDLKTVENYKTALNESIKISSTHNVFPIAGTTLIFCDVSLAMGICADPRKLERTKDNKRKPTPAGETAILLALMCEIACEDCQVILFGSSKHRFVQPSKKPLLEHAQSLLHLSKYLSKGETSTAKFPEKELTQILWDKVKVDNLIILTHSNTFTFLENFLLRYRQYVNPDLLFVNVDVTGQKASLADDGVLHHENDIYLSGSSDQILRFIAERGNKSQLNYVENIDTKYKLKATPRSSILTETNKKISPRVLIPKWKILRVFISSTFRDMHGERDLLIRYVFPELRSRAKSFCIDLHEIDLRWGITEEEATSSKLLEVCLNEVRKCDLFIGILGERYGYIPDISSIPEDPQFDWIREYPPGASITELEFYLGALSNPSVARGKAFFYIRNEEFIQNVPQPWKTDFLAEDEVCEKKIKELKHRVISSSLEVFDQYPCSWGGYIRGKPSTADLEEFGKRVFNNIWNAIEVFYKVEDLETSEDDLWMQETHLQEAFANKHNETFVGFQKNIVNCLKAIKEDTSYVILHGRAGSGKTALIAHLLKILRQDQHILVFPHFVGATPNSSCISDIIARLSSEINKHIKLDKADLADELINPVSKFKYLLQKAAETKWKIIFLLDGLDNLDAQTTSHALAWLPSRLPEGLKIVCSVDDNIKLLNEIKSYFSSVLVKIQPLASTERAEMVRQLLSLNRKALSESAFNNQMTVLISKREASLPVFLSLSCEQLRLYGIFENISEKLKALPPTINGLLQEAFYHLEEEHGPLLVQPALELLLVACHGLKEVELYDLINLYNNICLDNIIFEDILQKSIEAQDTVPPAKFAKFIQDLKGLLKPVENLNDPNAVLILNHIEMLKSCSFHEKLRERKSGNSVIHKIIAGYFYKVADPHLDNSWSGVSVRAFTLLIPHLVKGNCPKTAAKVLTNLQFLEKKAKLGLQLQLLEDYHLIHSSVNDTEPVSYDTVKFSSRKTDSKRNYYSAFKIDNDDKERLQEYKVFISHNYYYLTHSPGILLQQALNEPECTSPCNDAKTILTTSSKPLFHWINKPQDTNPCSLTLTFSKPIISVAASSDNQLVALGSIDGIIKIFNINTGQEEKTLIGHSNSISSLCFLGLSKLCSASLDKSLSLWDVTHSYRIAVMTGHQRSITSCCYNQENNLLVSVGLDCNIWVWNSQNGKEISSIKKEISPINCVAFHPTQQKIIVGLWDCTIRIWDLISKERKAILRGHQFSVTSVAISTDGKYLVSGDLKGEIKLWSATHGNQIGTFGGHSTMSISRICFFHSDTSIASVGEDNKLKVWSFHLGSHYQTIEGPSNASVTSMITDYKGDYLFISYNNLYLHKVDIATGNVECKIKLLSNISCLNFVAAHGRYFIAVGQENGEIMVLDENNVKKVYGLIGHDSIVTTIGSNTNAHVISGSVDGMVLIHKIPAIHAEGNERKPIQEEKSHTDMVTCICAYENYFATVSRDRSLCVWQEKEMYSRKKHSCVQYDYFVIDNCSSDWITSCCWFSEESKQKIMIGSTNTNIMTIELDLQNKKAKEITLFGNHQAPIVFLDKVHNNLISGSSDGVIKVHSPNKAELNSIPGIATNHMMIIRKPRSVPVSDEQSFDESPKLNIWENIRIARTKYKGMVEILNLKHGNELHHLTGHSEKVCDLCITSDEKMITCSLDKTVRIWQPKHKNILDETFEKYTIAHKQKISGIDFSLKTNQLLTCSRDGVVILWQMDSNFSHLEPLSTIQAHGKPINSVVFIQDENVDFATASDDGDVKFWIISCDTSIQYSFKKNFDYPVKTLSYKEDSNALLISGWNGVLSTYFLKNKIISSCCSVNQSWIKDSKFLPNETGIIFADEDGYLYSFSNSNREKPRKLFNFRNTSAFKADTSHYVMINCLEVPSSSENQQVFIGTSHGKIIQMTTPGFQRSIEPKFYQVHSDCVTGIFADIKTNHIITASSDHYIKVWSVDKTNNFNLVGKFPCKAPITSVKVLTLYNNYLFVISGDVDGALYFLKFRLKEST